MTASLWGISLAPGFGFPVATEEALVKVSDRREALVADKKGVNSSVRMSLQGARLTGHQRLEGYKTRSVDIHNSAVTDMS